MKSPIPGLLTMTSFILALNGCSQGFTVSVNDQSVYDPGGRLFTSQVEDADLQGCINLAVRQQNLDNPEELNVLSCANSQIASLENSISRRDRFGLSLRML